MSSRYTITTSADQLKERFSVDITEAYKPTFNGAPTHILPVITSEHPEGISFFYWGATPNLANNRAISQKLYGAKQGELLTKTSYRNALQSRRCLIPADGYYIWKKISKKGRTPYWIHLPNQQLMSFAGIWDEYEDEEGTMHHTFRMIIVESNNIVESEEDMPAILDIENEKSWLNESTSSDELIGMLKTYPSGKMECHSVSPSVGNSEVDTPDLIKHVPPADQFGNYTLFS